MTSGPFRLVPLANNARFRLVPTPMQAMSPARAALGGTLHQQGPEGPFGGSNSIGPSAASKAENAVSSMAGLGDNSLRERLRGGINSQYMPYSNMFNQAGLETEAGAVLQQTGAGRVIAQMIGAQHSLDFGRSWSSMNRPGGMFYGRSTGSQSVASGKPKTGPDDLLSPEFWQRMWKGISKAYDDSEYLFGLKLNGPWLNQDQKFDLANLLTQVPKEWASLATHLGAAIVNHFTKYPVGPGGPVPPSPNAGYYPSGAPEQSGPAVMTNLARLTLAEALKRMGQQAHSPAGPASGGGGTSSAPEKLVLRGAKHWYDVVASPE